MTERTRPATRLEPRTYARSELVAALGSVHHLRRAVHEGVVRRVLHGVYAPAALPDTPALRWQAARQVLPERAVLSHWSALWVLGLDMLPRDRHGLDLLDVVVPRGLHLEPRPGIRPHSALLTDADLVEVDGRPVSSAARAATDVARTFGVVEGVACGDAALRGGVTTLDRLGAAVDRAGGLRGVVAAREALPLLDGRSESLMESRIRVDYRLTGGLRLRPQVDLYSADGEHRGRGDLYLDGVVVEYDGRAERLEKARFVADRRRQSGLSDLGLEIRRVTSTDYYRTPPLQRLAVVQRALAVAKRRTDRAWCFGPDTLRPPRGRPLPTLAERAAA